MTEEERKEKKREYQLQYRIKNKDKQKEYDRQYRKEHRKESKNKTDKWKKNNKDKVKQIQCRYKLKADNDPVRFIRCSYNSFKINYNNMNATKEEFVNYILDNTNFLILHGLWLKNRIKDNKPTIFLINNNNGFYLYNLICAKYKEYKKTQNGWGNKTSKIKVCIIDDNDLITYADSIMEAYRITSVSYTSIVRYLDTNKSFKGYRFETIKENE